MNKHLFLTDKKLEASWKYIKIQTIVVNGYLLLQWTVVYEHFKKGYTTIFCLPLVNTALYGSDSSCWIRLVGYVCSWLAFYTWFTQGLKSDLHLAEITCVAWVLFTVITFNSLAPYKPTIERGLITLYLVKLQYWRTMESRIFHLEKRLLLSLVKCIPYFCKQGILFQLFYFGYVFSLGL